MKLSWNEDQQAVLDAVARVAAQHRTPVLDGNARFQRSTTLDDELQAGGYFDAAITDGLGLPVAAALVMALAALPACTEVAASALLLPGLPLPRPCAVLWRDRGAPARFLDQARCVACIDDQALWFAPLRDGDATPVDSLFAVPMGRLRSPDTLPWQRADIDPARALGLGRLALAAEITGNLAAALASVVEHVSHRRQFGRPLGAFQAVQHRLAQGATTVEGLRWLVLAAADGRVPAALAVAQAQQAVRPLCHDLHQFMGAMGLTLEHPLHRWTYRARRLQSEGGGADHHFIAAARSAWPCPSSPRA